VSFNKRQCEAYVYGSLLYCLFRTTASLLLQTNMLCPLHLWPHRNKAINTGMSSFIRSNLKIFWPDIPLQLELYFPAPGLSQKGDPYWVLHGGMAALLNVYPVQVRSSGGRKLFQWVWNSKEDLWTTTKLVFQVCTLLMDQKVGLILPDDLCSIKHMDSWVTKPQRKINWSDTW